MAKGLDSQFARARAAESRKDFPAAAAIYVEIATRFPNNSRVHKAWAGMKQRIADLSGPHVEQGFREALACYEDGRLREAMERLEALLAEHSGQPALHNVHGAVLLALGRPEEGERAFRRAIALDPAVADGHNNLGNALRDQRRFEEACGAYRAALQRRQDYPEAWNNLGTVLQ